mmetsp:Transcript_3529/g.7048  ORF Transcript_3529/g.7048 Transcript_3529/m.7048 type:complete len:124 (-) Transcript_3529:240-611(-)|eukprot:CAMPEP_0167803136 /NCGR_PEP_ID=MMETSP0111_2-20121227/19598_1 /TAXON_ID=91324 /ORGANISM="Lotharella globosa, Strain CCCM811" /LENGTH=123 /DNA_ID=CAMNT_0007699431 /DNA_START=17 /DNA_END=388 /DNA_ORIENTATION=+
MNRNRRQKGSTGKLPEPVSAEVMDLKLATFEKRMMQKIDAKHQEMMDKLEGLSKILHSADMLGTPDVKGKVQALMSQVAALNLAVNDVSLHLDDQNGGMAAMVEEGSKDDEKKDLEQVLKETP